MSDEPLVEEPCWHPKCPNVGALECTNLKFPDAPMRYSCIEHIWQFVPEDGPK